jgi:hypothetical protein
MAWRAIQDSVATSESLSQLNDFTERLYWRMLAKSDPWGRLPGSPKKLRGLCVPLVARASENRIEEALVDLAYVNRIERYEVDGTPYVQLVDFAENQPNDVLGRSGARYTSRFPGPTNSSTRSRAESVRGTPAESESESDKKTATAVSSEIEAIYNHWRTARAKKNSRYDHIHPGRLRKIKARLKEFPASELIRAIDGVASDPWAERPLHDDLTVIFRSAEQVDRFLAFADSPPAAPNGRVSAARLTELTEEVFHEAG